LGGAQHPLLDPRPDHLLRHLLAHAEAVFAGSENQSVPTVLRSAISRSLHLAAYAGFGGPRANPPPGGADPGTPRTAARVLAPPPRNRDDSGAPRRPLRRGVRRGAGGRRLRGARRGYHPLRGGERGADHRRGNPRAAGRRRPPKGAHVRLTFLGTGHAFFGAGRAQSAILVEDAAGAWLLECGVTTSYLLKRQGIDDRSIQMALVTHLHGDHFGGLPFLLLMAREDEQRTSPLHLVGPPALGARTRELLRAFYAEVDADHWPFELEYHALSPGQSISVLGRRIRAFAADHMHDGTALCVRVESEGKVIAFTGDTGKLAPLSELADNADLLVCECTLAEASQAPGVKHLTVEDIARLRPTWSARRVLLTHLSAESRRAARALSGVELTDDGL